MKKFAFILLLLTLLTSCITTTSSTELTLDEQQVLKSTLISTEVTALKSLNANKIALSLAKTFAFDNSISSYSMLPQYNYLISNLRADLSVLFEEAIKQEVILMEDYINQLEITNPQLFLQEGYQSVSWYVERQLKDKISSNFSTFIEKSKDGYLANSFASFSQEAMIWRENQIVLSVIKQLEVPIIPQLPNNAILTTLVTEAFLTELAFSEQRIRTSFSTELQ